MEVIVWNIVDQNGDDLDVPHRDYGILPLIGDMFNFWVDDHTVSNKKQSIRGRVIDITHDIRWIEHNGSPLNHYRYAVIKINVLDT